MKSMILLRLVYRDGFWILNLHVMNLPIVLCQVIALLTPEVAMTTPVRPFPRMYQFMSVQCFFLFKSYATLRTGKSFLVRIYYNMPSHVNLGSTL